MTENDAIIQLNFDMEMVRFNPDTEENLTLEQIKANNEDNYKTYLADEVAITALMEIQQYRAIGTVEGYKRAIETSKENYLLYAEYKAIGTIEEFKALKNKHIEKDNMVISSSDLMTILNSGSEELKEVRKGFEENRKAGYKHGYADGYAKGIDDLVNGLLNWKSQDEEYKSFSDVCNEIAEQLKGGAT